MCTALACGVPCSMPVKLGHLSRRTCSACNAMIGPWSDRSAVSSQRMWPLYGQANYWQSFSLRTSTSFWEREGFAGLGMWSVQVVQSEQHMIYRLKAGGCREAWANMEETDRKTAMSGTSPQLTLKKGAPGDQVWDLLCVQLASYLERGPLMWMMPQHLHVNQKSDYDMMMMIRGQVQIFIKWCTNVFLCLKIVLIIANSADPDEMPHLRHFIWIFTVCQSTCFYWLLEWKRWYVVLYMTRLQDKSVY